MLHNCINLSIIGDPKECPYYSNTYGCLSYPICQYFKDMYSTKKERRIAKGQLRLTVNIKKVD